MKYDIENFITEIETYLKANLNTKLTALDSEKGDFTIEKISSAAYIQQDIENAPETALANNPFIIHGVVGIDKTVSGPGVIKNYSYDINLVFNKQPDNNDYKRLWRYQRGLSEVIEDGWNNVNQSLKIEVEDLTPIPISLRNAPSNEQWVTGIRLSFNLT